MESSKGLFLRLLILSREFFLSPLSPLKFVSMSSSSSLLSVFLSFFNFVFVGAFSFLALPPFSVNSFFLRSFVILFLEHFFGFFPSEKSSNL